MSPIREQLDRMDEIGYGVLLALVAKVDGEHNRFAANGRPSGMASSSARSTSSTATPRSTCPDR